MIHLTYYREVLRNAKNDVIKEEMNNFLNELQQDQKRLSILISKIDALRNKYKNNKEITNKDLKVIFKLNNKLKELIIVED